MSVMEPSAASQPALYETPRTDAAETDTTKKVKAHGDRNFETQILPGLVGPDFPFPPSVSKLFRKLFRHKDTPLARLHG